MYSYMPWQKKTSNTGKIVLGTLIGIAAGLTAGFLTAPRAGRETRRLITDRTNEALNKVGKNITESKDKIGQKSKKKVEEIAEDS